MAGIAVAGVRKSFGATEALRGVSLDIAPGEFVALVGPSGCGKTTLMRIVAGIEAADEGRIVIADRDVTRLRPAGRDVAMVFQSYALYPHLTVRQNIAVPLVMRRLSPWQRLPLVGPLLPGARAAARGIAAEVTRVAEPLGLLGMLDRRPAQLSGGQRQRVALARAVVRHPRAFLMDEPLSNLDAALRVQTRREIVEIHRRVGAATLYVTHDQTEALTMADRVAVMMAGEILQVAPPERIYADPADLRVAAFIGSPRINTVPGELDATGLVRVAGRVMGLRVTGAGPAMVTLAVRPEDLAPVPDDTADAALDAVAEHLEFLGEGVLLHARHAAPDGSALILRAASADRAALPRSGHPMRLGMPAGRVLVFRPDGKRVAARPLAAAHVPA
jgi:multiple sugar transport system ATP-binding protein